MADKTELYRAVVSYVATTAGMLSQLDIPEILAAIEHAHAVGPILDPTLYRDKAKAMEEDAELLKAALPLWQAGKKRFAAAGSEAAEEKGERDAWLISATSSSSSTARSSSGPRSSRC